MSLKNDKICDLVFKNFESASLSSCYINSLTDVPPSLLLPSKFLYKNKTFISDVIYQVNNSINWKPFATLCFGSRQGRSEVKRGIPLSEYISPFTFHFKEYLYLIINK